MTIPESTIPLNKLTVNDRRNLVKPYGLTVYVEGATTYQVLLPNGLVRDPLDPTGGRKVPLNKIFIKKMN